MRTCALPFALALLPLIASCTEIQSGEQDEPTATRVSERASVAYKEKITDWSDWNPWQRIPVAKRRELNVLQMDWLDLAYRSMQDMNQFTRKSDNPIATRVLKKKTYDTQKKNVQELLKKIQQQGLDNWPMTLEEKGLAFAPGLVAYPNGGNTFQTAEGCLLGLMLNGGDARSLDQALMTHLAGSLKFEQLNETSSDSILKSKLGNTLYVTLPPGTFEIRQMPAFGFDPHFPGSTALAIYHNGDRKGEIDLCYTPWLLVVKQPGQLRINTRKERGLLERMIRSQEEEQRRTEKDNQQRVKQALRKVADQLAHDFQKKLDEYVKKGYGRVDHIQNQAAWLRHKFAGEDTTFISVIHVPKAFAFRSPVQQEVLFLKEQKVPLSELARDPRIAHIIAPSYTFNELRNEIKEPEAKYAKMMRPFTSKYDDTIYDLIRCNLQTGKFVVREADLQTIQNYVAAGYRPRRPFEQGYVPSKKDIAMYGRLLTTLREEHRKGNVTIFNEEGESVAVK